MARFSKVPDSGSTMKGPALRQLVSIFSGTKSISGLEAEEPLGRSPSSLPCKQGQKSSEVRSVIHSVSRVASPLTVSDYLINATGVRDGEPEDAFPSQTCHG